MQPEQPPVEAAGTPLGTPDVYEDTLPVQQRVWRETQPPPPPPTPARPSRRPRVWLISSAVLLVVAAILGAVAISGRSGHGHAGGVGAASVRPTMSPASPLAASSPRPSGSVSPPGPVQIRATLLFPGDSATPDAAAQASITSLAARIRPYGHGSVEVDGYTATLGTGGQDELQLSLARAQAVAGLLRQTLAGTSITVAARGFGAANPVAPNSSDAGRARNRRVEIVFTTVAG